jgi:multiple sugar transport system permease protein
MSIQHNSIPGAALAPARRRKLMSGDRLFWTLCLVPPLVVLAAVFIFPLIYSFQMSLTDESLLTQARFIGGRNYVLSLSDRNVLNALQVTVVFAVITLVIQMLLGFGLALLLHRVTVGRDLLRTLIVMPVLLTPVIMGLQWRMMLNYDFGIVNYLIGLVGVPRQGWLINATLALVSVVVIDVWHNTGFVTMLLSAGLATLPGEPFEAAEVDGATAWQRVWHVTLPLLKPIILVVLLFRSYGALRLFDTVFSLTEGGPGRATESLSYYIFTRMFLNWQVGSAAAVAYILFAITLVICLIVIRAIGREERI